MKRKEKRKTQKQILERKNEIFLELMLRFNYNEMEIETMQHFDLDHLEDSLTIEKKQEENPDFTLMQG